MANYNRKDSYYKKAKEEGYRSRAYYKLQDIQNKHKVIKRGAKVLDMGAWPGGWMQLSEKIVGKSGLVTGIDLVEIEPFSHLSFLPVSGFSFLLYLSVSRY